MRLLLVMLERYAPGQGLRILATTIAGGLLTAGVLAVVNHATAKGDHPSSLLFGLIMVVALVLMYLCQRLAARMIVTAFEDVAYGLREELSANLAAAPLRAVEQLESRISRAAGDLAMFSATIESWAGGLQNIAFLISLTLVVVTISVKALVIWLLALGVGVWRLGPRIRRQREVGRTLSQASGDLGKQVESLLDGFVQIKLDGELAEDVVEDILAATDRVYEKQWTMQEIAIDAFTVTLVLISVLTRVPAAFADPRGIGLSPADGYEMIAFATLAIGPLIGSLQAIPEWARAEAAVVGINEVLEAIAVAREPGHEDEYKRASAQAADVDGPTFETLELRGASFSYEGTGGQEFCVGPIDLRVRRGELVFITGGNGSGKTTLMKMLLGLYPLTRGGLRVDREPIVDGALAYHRSQFTVIFSYQHLFRQLYGLEAQVSQAQVDALLERFGITDVVRYEQGRFDRLDLSTGQRVRLAMVVALLEDRPICVFDEWTANQDPETTRFYHDTLLPELIAAGKTVIAVSHDDRFFHHADRVIVMAEGRIVS